MIENTESLLPQGHVRAFTLGIEDESLNELDRLLVTLGVETTHRVMAPVRKIVSGTYFGTGKLDEIRDQGEAAGIDLFVIELRRYQLRFVQIRLDVVPVHSARG